MPTLHLTDDELEAVFQLCAEECEIALCEANGESHSRHLGLLDKCFNAVRDKANADAPPSIPKATRISGAPGYFVDEWPKGVA